MKGSAHEIIYGIKDMAIIDQANNNQRRYDARCPSVAQRGPKNETRIIAAVIAITLAARTLSKNNSSWFVT